jgi:cytochrome c oxidase subunit 1
MLGNSDMIFERMNSLSLWIVVISSGMIIISSIIDGGVNCGWTFYVPLSS